MSRKIEIGMTTPTAVCIEPSVHVHPHTCAFIVVILEILSTKLNFLGLSIIIKPWLPVKEPKLRERQGPHLLPPEKPRGEKPPAKAPVFHG